MTVYILAFCRRPELLPAALLVFDSLRTGFPTANIVVGVNTQLPEARASITNAATNVGAEVMDYTPNEYAHPMWIKHWVDAAEGRIVFCDTDIVFWKNCEWFEFPTLMAGFYCPQFACEFSKAISIARLHTSFLWINDAAGVRRAVSEDYPHSVGQYNPYDPIRPFVYNHAGRKYFQDTCAGLYQALGGSAFSPEHLDCYDHLNAATCIDVVAPRMEFGKQMKQFHTLVYANPKLAKGAWARYAAYYRQRAT